MLFFKSVVNITITIFPLHSESFYFNELVFYPDLFTCKIECLTLRDQKTGKIFEYRITLPPPPPILLATVEAIELKNTTAGSDISLGTWNVTDKYDLKSFRISYSFPFVSIAKWTNSPYLQQRPATKTVLGRTQIVL